MPTFGSLFSGIGGIDFGLERAGWECRWQVEIDDYRRGILKRHWPGVPRWGDVRTVGVRDSESRLGGQRGSVREDVSVQPVADERASGEYAAARVDLICGGFPCQDLSVAGRRAGLQGERSSLFFEFARIADALRPTWLLVENVPGLLSSNGGRDFAIVLATLAELGYGVAWRVLDSRYFGVPQRRRRVFIVGHLGARSAEPFLPFLEGGEGDPAEGGAEGPSASSTAGEGAEDGGYVANIVGSLANASGKRGWKVSAENAADGQLVTRSLNAKDGHRFDGDSDTFVTAPSLMASGAGTSRPGGPGLAQEDEYLVSMVRMREGKPGGGKGPLLSEDESLTLGQANDQAMFTASAVRRLTPVECCRLQGFPDDWLGPPNEPPDSPRYAALGDAVTVNVAEWIGRRLMETA